MSEVLEVPSLTGGTSCLEAAICYADAGWSVLPVQLETKHAGSVVGAGWPGKSSRVPAQLSAWFGAGRYGLALHVGRSGAVAFDVDAPELLPPVLAKALDEFQPPFQSTRQDAAGRGHYVFKQPAGLDLGNGKGRLKGGWGEVRGRNGIIVVQPTPHVKADVGGRYEWVRTGALPTLPTELVAALVPVVPSAPPRPSSLRGSGAGGRGPYDLPALVQAILDAEQRNNAVFWAACRAGELVRFGRLRLEEGVHSLVQAGLAVGLSRVELVGHDGLSGTVHSGIRTGLGRSM